MNIIKKLKLKFQKKKVDDLDKKLQELAIKHAKEIKGLTGSITKEYVMPKFDEAKFEIIVRKIEAHSKYKKSVEAAIPVYDPKFSGVKFGVPEKEAWHLAVLKLEIIHNILRANGWVKKELWKEKGVNVTKYGKELALASVAYIDILKHYAKKFYESERLRISEGRKK
jgi:hypothetical protein